jgi:hypothetical protein
MKKTLIFGLLIIIFNITTTFANETWQQYIQRTHTMTENFRQGINTGNQNTWSNDKWGALLATTYWLETALEEIYRNAPGLSQEDRNIYRGLWIRRTESTADMIKLHSLAPLTNSDDRVIADRMEYWMKHLQNGGTIRIN